MKTKLLISVFILTFISLAILPAVSVRGADAPVSPTSSFEMPVVSAKSTQTTFMMSNYRSITTKTQFSSVNINRMGPTWDSWGDDPGGSWGGNPVDVGAPIGEVSLPIAFFALLIYFIYRRVTTSKRRSNF